MNPVLLFILLVTSSSVQGFLIVAAPRQTCTTKRAYAIFRMIRSQCATMGGAWNGNPGANQWIDCHVDWCDLPVSGPVSTGAAWGIDTDQTSTDTSSTRTYGIFRMTLRDCVNIRGRYNGNPTAGDWIECHVYMVRQDGLDRNNIQTLVMAGVNEWENKVAYGIIRMVFSSCLQIGGLYNGNPGASDWIECHLDICVSPAIECESGGLGAPVQVCRNPSSSVFTCEFTPATGRKLSVALSPNEEVSINQVVTTCGGYKVQPSQYTVVDI